MKREYGPYTILGCCRYGMRPEFYGSFRPSGPQACHLSVFGSFQIRGLQASVQSGRWEFLYVSGGSGFAVLKREIYSFRST